MNQAQLELLSQKELIEIKLSHPAAMKDEDTLAVDEAGPEAVIKLINRLTYSITELKERARAVDEQLNKRSRNSDPFLTDKFLKHQDRRQKSDKLVGGQKWHPGHTFLSTVRCSQSGLPVRVRRQTGRRRYLSCL
jgi:hypothetical protein